MKPLRTALLLGSCGTVLAGCGGGGGARPEPLAPAPVATPTPSPAPAPTPAVTPGGSSSGSGSLNGFDDSEYQASTAAVRARALTAYQAGATGKGVKIGIVDSGLNPNLAEFAGRIDPASQNVRNGAAISALGFHGNSVAAVAAAARNGSGIEGIAFDSTIIALNTANPNDCGSDGTCRHENKDIAKGVDLARAAGARVINISLGGSAPGDALIAAISRATQAGIVVVFAAGNSGAANPDELGLVSAQQGGHGLVILAGALDESGAIAGFANRAGTGAQYYLATLGQGVATFDQNGTQGIYWGSSYAAPAVSGAVALIASAFPNMSGAQIIDLLFRTADDLGATGVDSTYGRGALNLQRAFQPQGQLSFAGSSAPIALDQGNQASPAMGDALGSSTSLGAVILDGYSRAYAVELAGRLTRAAQERPLAQAIGGDVRTSAVAAGPVAVSLTVARNFAGQPEVGLAQAGLGFEDARKARALAGYALGRVTPRMAVAFGFSQSGRALQQRLAGVGDQAFLIARDPLSRTGFVSIAGSSIAVRQQLGRIGLTTSAETGKVWTDDELRRELERPGYSMAGLTADTRIGRALLTLGASRMKEEETVLGGRFGSAFTSGGATSWFADGSAAFDLGQGWGASARYRRGWTSIPGTGALVSNGNLGTEAWSLDLAKAFKGGHRFAFRVTQPLRVASGGLNLAVPISYDYQSGGVGYEQRFFNLAPTGREMDVEAAFGVAIWGGDLSLNAFVRRQPGHIATAPDDLGTAMRFTLGF